MYLLDTNVVSELRKANFGRADSNVVAWARRVPAVSMFLPAIALLELELGVQLMERRDAAQGEMLRVWMNGSVLPAFEGRILPVDAEVALRCAGLHVPNPRPVRDALIAATALVHGMTVVTRNTVDFGSTGVELLDPWQLSTENI